MRDRSDWQPDPQVFAKIDIHYGPLEVDLFASRLTYQCHRYYSWQPDPYAEAIHCRCLPARLVKGEGPPVVLNSVSVEQGSGSGGKPCYSNSTMEGSTMVLSAPVHAGGLAMPPPASTEANITSGSGINKPTTGCLEHIRDGYHNQGLSEQATSLIAKSWRRQTSLTTHSLNDGIVGVVNGVQIPFQDL